MAGEIETSTKSGATRLKLLIEEYWKLRGKYVLCKVILDARSSSYVVRSDLGMYEP